MLLYAIVSLKFGTGCCKDYGVKLFCDGGVGSHCTVNAFPESVFQ